MLNRLTFKEGLYNMFQWHFRGSRPMTRQYHDNWLRIDLEMKENHLPRCESDYNISLRPVGSEKVAISPLFSTSTHQTRHVEPPYSKLAHHQLQLQFTVSPICRICRTTCDIIRIHAKRKVSVYLQTAKGICHCLRGGVALWYLTNGPLYYCFRHGFNMQNKTKFKKCCGYIH